MKFFAIFTVLVAVAAADYSTWTLPQLSDAIQNPATNPASLPALEQALNDMMDSMFARPPMVPVDASAPVDLTGWTLNDLSIAMQDPATDPAMIPFIEQALNQMMDAIHAGIPVEAVGVPAKPLEVSYWTLQELDDALQNADTNPALVPYLEHALNNIMDELFSGNQVTVTAIVAPAGLAPAKPEPVEIPIAPPTPVVVAPSPVVVAPSPVVRPPASTNSPLVQIVVNIQEQA